MVKSRPLISIAHCTEKERVGSMSLPIQSTQSSSSAGRSAGNGASAGQAMPLASPAPSEGEEKKKKVTSSAYFFATCGQGHVFRLAICTMFSHCVK